MPPSRTEIRLQGSWDGEKATFETTDGWWVVVFEHDGRFLWGIGDDVPIDEQMKDSLCWGEAEELPVTIHLAATAWEILRAGTALVAPATAC